MSKRADAFNRSGVSRFINSPAGRVFRLVAGAGFLVVGYVFRDHMLGVISMAYSVLPLSAGAFDICFISWVLGGPLSGAEIREAQRQHPRTADENNRSGISAPSS